MQPQRHGNPALHTKPTSQGGGPGEASSDIHGGYGIPDPILIRCVVQTFHCTEAGTAIIAANDIDPVM